MKYNSNTSMLTCSVSKYSINMMATREVFMEKVMTSFFLFYSMYTGDNNEK